MVNWTFVELDDVASTQSIARGLASMGAADGTVVVAKSQSMGEGRFGRPWSSPVGGLYMSYILRPKDLPRPELASLVSATAVVRGVAASTGLSARIRWPNDVMVGKKKVAGVITEAQAYKGEVTQIIAGVGLNCNSAVSSPDSQNQTTSLSEELGKMFEVSELKLSILSAFSDLYDRWQRGDDMLAIWKETVATLGRKVSVKLKTSETPFAGTAEGIDPEGCLIIANEGEARALKSSDVEWLRELG